MGAEENRKVVNDLYAALGPQDTPALAALVAGTKRTGRMFKNRWVMAFSVCDGKIENFEEYADTQALAATHDVYSRAPSTRAPNHGT